MSAENEDQGGVPFINDWPLRRFVLLIFGLISVIICLSAFRAMYGNGINVALAGFALIPFILVVPGAAILKVGRYHGLGFIRSMIYSVALGIAFIMALGFSLNLFHYAGIKVDPLRLTTINVTYVVALLALLWLAKRRDGDYHPPIGKFILDSRIILTWMFAICLPFAVIVASVWINTESYRLMMFWTVFLICLLPLAVYSKPRNYAPLILSMSIALLLHRVLITNYLIGYDIFSEYAAANFTTINGWWDISQTSVGFTANTALSIITLAPVLTNMTGIDALQLLKFVYPIIFSLVPLGIYVLVKDEFGAKAGFLASGLFVGYQAFFNLMIQLGKQEIAELFLIALLLVLTQLGLSRKKKLWLIVLFLLCMLFSHYGIGVLVLGLFALVIALQSLDLIWQCWKTRRENWKGYVSWAMSTIRSWIGGQLNFRLISIILFIFAGTAYIIWYAITGSGIVLQYIPIIGPYFSGNPVGGGTGGGTGPAGITLTQLDALEFLLIDYGSLINSMEKYVVLITQILTVIGVFWVFKEKEMFKKVNKDYLFFGLASAIFLIICYVVPNISSSITFSRIFTFTLIFLCGFIFVGVFALVTSLRKILRLKKTRLSIPGMEKDRVSLALTCLAVMAMLFFNTGVAPAISGDYVNSLTLNESASWAVYTDSDVIASKWLSDPEHIGDYAPNADYHRFPVFTAAASLYYNLRYQYRNDTTDSFLFLSEWNNKYGYVYPVTITNTSVMNYCPLENITRQVGDEYDMVYSSSTYSTVVYFPPSQPDTNAPGQSLYTYEFGPIYFMLALTSALLVIGMISWYASKKYQREVSKRKE